MSDAVLADSPYADDGHALAISEADEDDRSDNAWVDGFIHLYYLLCTGDGDWIDSDLNHRRGGRRVWQILWIWRSATSTTPANGLDDTAPSSTMPGGAWRGTIAMTKAYPRQGKCSSRATRPPCRGRERDVYRKYYGQEPTRKQVQVNFVVVVHVRSCRRSDRTRTSLVCTLVVICCACR
jgi:hypothetical protein